MSVEPRVTDAEAGSDAGAEAGSDAGADTGADTSAAEAAIAGLKFGVDGLLAAIVQDDESDRVLMLAWMDAEAVRRTLTTGRVTYWSRSRGEYWRKGDTSGHRQYVRSVASDCDGDTLLVRVVQIGAACHTGTRSCFDGRELSAVVGDPAAE
ncbi:phosphoribosyl-AMP cyclohydrolase [Leucobacter sp. BZR 635]|uniref:phosphoribosyl-AMP cyclohydrolase n=1 Tax=Leucobacter sp. BZR 635 TaxID=3378705 RepID=UPI003A83D204